MTKKFDALPPPGMAWTIGKTAASIAFVNETETFLRTCCDTRNTGLLLAAVKKIKSGKVVLHEWLTPQEYLDQQAPK